MNKKLAWVLVAILVIVGGYFSLKSRTQTAQAPGTGTNTNTQTPQSQTAGPQSITDLFAAGKSQQCTFADDTSGAVTNGTIYVGGGKMRGDFMANANGTNVSSHMISDGTTAYTWMEGQSTGYKVIMSTGQGGATQNSAAADANRKLDYKCSSWSVDSAKFNLPAGVNFTDTASMMPQGTPPAPTPGSPPPSPQDMKALQCAACNNVAADQRAQCLAALQCK
jgi:hypothetical protein